MNDKIRVFPNGFLFTAEEDIENLPSHYEHSVIQGKYHYYYDKDSRMKVYNDDESFIIIHGLFVHIDPESGDITEESPKLLLSLFSNNYEQFLEKLDYLGGRFVIIIGDRDNVYVYPDATGSRTAYYSKDFNSIASHSKLLKEVFKIPNDPLSSTTYDYRIFFDYSLFMNVESLLPNFYLNLNDGKKIRFFPRENNRYRNTDEADKFKAIEFLWKEQLKHFVNNNEKLIFSLTGGADSRLSLAMAKDYMEDIESFTYTPYEDDIKPETTKDELLYLDKQIVNQILDNYKLNHEFMYFRDDNISLNTFQNRIILTNTVRNHGKGLLPHYLKHFKEKDIIHIRANLLEIGRAYYITHRSTNSSNSIRNHARHKLLKGLKSSDAKYKKIEGLINSSIEKMGYNEPLFDYHLLDLYYWENRMGRWMPEVLNETDVAFETFLPFNMRAIIDASLSFSLKQRKTDYLFNELINRNHPLLNFFGKNETQNLYEQTKRNEEDHFNSFGIYDSNSNLIDVRDSINNLVYLPKDYIQKNYYAESKPYFYNSDKGIVNLSVLNEYFNPKGTKILKYSILLNNNVILSEDLALWKEVNNISITGLTRDDEIKIRITALKDIKSISWENASKTYINNIVETPMKNNIKFIVSSNSPYSNY
ncbi:hypothetical protein WN59_10180 [Salinicoccus sediminis]|uniref:Asparagine synthetase domain-containing protein n=1 Tax=Salinicoccus sediminis TaxID=1432562 RepID=A0A0M2SMX4_9STAP|nr:hypothetical protein [Salinicoccus sediminis]KKK33960.1 hypothetical protein WN59_10180 [Salinicoccus sediminis]